MKLTITPRAGLSKSEIKKIRREKNVPAVIYGMGKDVEKITVDGSELRAILRALKHGQLATTVFELSLDGKKRKAIVKDIQYNVSSYDIEHIDFVLLSSDQKVNVNVPIKILGMAECPGIKLGGIFRQVIRTLKVSCLPKDIPSEFQIDISAINISESKRLSDIAIPSGVKALAPLDEVAVVVAKSKVVA